MKLQTVKPAALSLRCTHRTAAGRQCRLSVSDGHSGLCPHHHADQKENERADVSEILTKYSQGFQTAQGINYSLQNLYRLAAQNRISPRRASVLAYIGSLLLRTLPAIDADRAAGILDPTKISSASTPAQNTSHIKDIGPAKDLTPAKIWDTSGSEPDSHKKPS